MKKPLPTKRELDKREKWLESLAWKPTASPEMRAWMNEHLFKPTEYAYFTAATTKPLELGQPVVVTAADRDWVAIPLTAGDPCPASHKAIVVDIEPENRVLLITNPDIFGPMYYAESSRWETWYTWG